VGHVACKGAMRNVYKISVQKPEGKRPLERPSCRWENNMKIYIKQIGCECVWTGFMAACEHNNEPLCSISGWEFLDQLSNY
jgi:hypothetical protein